MRVAHSHPVRRTLVALALVLPVVAGSAFGLAQVTTATVTTTAVGTGADHIFVMPQTHRVPRSWSAVTISAVAANISIVDQLATTTLEISVTNPGSSPQQAELLLPVPDGVTVRSLQYDGTGPEPTARLLPRAEARRIYDSIVHASRDPALLEFAGMGVIRSSAFPVPAGATQKIRITFEQLLVADAGRIDYVLPKTESLATGTGIPWTIKATVKSSAPISTVFSPSHDMASERTGAGDFTVTIPANSASGPGTFRLSALMPTDSKAASATLYAYPDAGMEGGKGGYFLLVAAVPTEKPEGAKPVPREMTIVLDRSGSMQGGKFEQARKAAVNVINGLAPGERFNIIDYSDTVELFAKEPVVLDDKARAEALAYLGRLQANGGTNLHDALMSAVTAPAHAGSMGLVLFLTDGLPTVGERGEVAIRDHVKASNKAGRRIFSFGVGFDVNTPLLSGLARAAKGAPTFILPDEDVEVKVSQVSRRLRGPTLGSPTLVMIGADGKPTTRATRDLQPAVLDDVFEGDQVVILGQYTGESDTLKINLGGEYFGTPRTFEFNLKLDAATPRNGFVPRLWATRKVAALVEEIRQSSAEPGSAGTEARTKELVDQITQLSMRWGVMTPYTSFLATEQNPGEWDRLDALGRVHERVLEESRVRGGAGGVAQDADVDLKLKSVNAQTSNSTYAVAPSAVPADGRTRAFARYSGPGTANGGGGGEGGGKVIFNTVQNINAQTYYNRNAKWVDGRVLSKETEKPEVEVTVGTPEFEKVADALIDEGQAGVLSLEGDILILVGGKLTLIRQTPTPAVTVPETK
jgi:Ca-activated chloride channel family protein